MLIGEGELPCQEVAVDGRKLLAVDVDGVVALPQMPALVHFTDHIPRSILDVHVAVDEVEGTPHPEDDLRPCTLLWSSHSGHGALLLLPLLCKTAPMTSLGHASGFKIWINMAWG